MLFAATALALVLVGLLHVAAPAQQQSSDATGATEYAPDLSQTPVGPMDSIPRYALVSPNGRWEALIEEGTGRLFVREIGTTARTGAMQSYDLGSAVQPQLAFSPDGNALVYPQGEGGGTNLYLANLPPTASPKLLVDWPGPEDSPAFSPDGRRLAFVSWRAGTGINSIYVMELEKGPGGAVQVTNVGIGPSPETGKPPPGWVPPPDSGSIRFDGEDLRWTSNGKEYSATIPYQ